MTGASEVVKLTASELRNNIAKKKLSPVEVLEAFIARIEALNPALNAVTATCFTRAREEAKVADQAVASGQELPDYLDGEGDIGIV